MQLSWLQILTWAPFFSFPSVPSVPFFPASIFPLSLLSEEPYYVTRPYFTSIPVLIPQLYLDFMKSSS